MERTYLVITSIASSKHPVLIRFSEEAAQYKIPFLLIGDTKSPADFELPGCDYYSISRQEKLPWDLARELPVKHYARKNLGYLVAMQKGAEIIIETDDDNLPFSDFWNVRQKSQSAYALSNNGWVNVYKYFTEKNIWPRGFALERIQDNLPELKSLQLLDCPIQQGLADENPDIDAIYRLTLPLPVVFDKHESIAIGKNTWCPFNSQNTTWFKEAFPLLYLPSYCSFRMTDIWRSFVAQRIAWSCGWSVIFHNSTVWQERNDHNLLNDFKDEISGYLNNSRICSELQNLELEEGAIHINDNLIRCYELLIKLGFIEKSEINLIKLWIKAIQEIKVG